MESSPLKSQSLGEEPRGNRASTSGGNPNTIDTVENVIVPTPTAGAWTVEVRAAEINQDAALVTRKREDVAFGLVVTGAAQ